MGEAIGAKHFTCESCHKEFESERPDGEAEAESKLLWGEQPEEAMAVICDDCFKKFYAWAKTQGLVTSSTGK